MQSGRLRRARVRFVVVGGDAFEDGDGHARTHTLMVTASGCGLPHGCRRRSPLPRSRRRAESSPSRDGGVPASMRWPADRSAVQEDALGWWSTARRSRRCARGGGGCSRGPWSHDGSSLKAREPMPRWSTYHPKVAPADVDPRLAHRGPVTRRGGDDGDRGGGGRGESSCPPSRTREREGGEREEEREREREYDDEYGGGSSLRSPRFRRVQNSSWTRERAESSRSRLCSSRRRRRCARSCVHAR